MHPYLRNTAIFSSESHSSGKYASIQHFKERTDNQQNKHCTALTLPTQAYKKGFSGMP